MDSNNSALENFSTTKSNVASMICEKNDTDNCYTCNLAHDHEISVFKKCLENNTGCEKTDKKLSTECFPYQSTHNKSELFGFITGLGATKLKTENKWVFMDTASKINIHSFNNGNEIHIIKTPTPTDRFISNIFPWQ
mgnify:FL=1